MLPADDVELDAMIETAARENDLDGFLPLVIAALHAGRKVDAHHLAQGAALMYANIWIGLAAFHMTGDVAEPLMEAVRHHRVEENLRAACLFIVAVWCRERRGGVLPEDLITLARMQARTQKLDRDPFMALLAVALQTKDEGLDHILHTRSGDIETALQRKLTQPGDGPEAKEKVWKTIQDVARAIGEVWLGWYQKPVIDQVPAKPPSYVPTPIPLRRAVARVGRNEPCPCGSGKKYKHCCVDKDQTRLMHSSPVAGQTWEELMTDPEAHLTKVWMERCDAYQVARFDPKKIPAELWPAYFERLSIFRQYDRATEALEQLDYSEALAITWNRIASFVTQGRLAAGEPAAFVGAVRLLSRSTDKLPGPPCWRPPLDHVITGPRRLCLEIPRPHPMGRVVHHHHEHAFPPPSFKPVVGESSSCTIAPKHGLRSRHWRGAWRCRRTVLFPAASNHRRTVS